jgi:asparagine synthase (glutamine-hydrolysing)
MPGIVGVITSAPRERAMSQLLRMVQAMNHEPFCQVGTWSDAELGAYVGWVVREGAFAAGMPLFNERRDVILVFAGEEFPEPDIRIRLRARGHQVEETGASYLVHSYEDDPAFPAGLNGTFHGLVGDRAAGTATLFNDRCGSKRLYYHEGDDAFYFAAEAKAILAARPELRTIDIRGLGEFMSCGCVLQNRTVFRDIHVLPGAAAWVFGEGSCHRKRSYFQPRQWEEQPPLDAESYYQEIRRVFAHKLPRYFGGAAPIGISLTGGLDSRMIMAWQQFPSGSLPCYTFAGTYRDCRDVIVARQVATVCRQPHHLITIGDEFLSKFPYFAERSVYLSDGTVDVSRAPALYANQQARGIAPIRMTGVYGSEILRGLRGFKPSAPMPGLFHTEFLPHVHAAQMTYAQVSNLHAVSFTAFQSTPQRGVDALEESQLDVRTPFLDNDILRAAFRAPRGNSRNGHAGKDICLRLIADGNPELRKIATDRGLGGARNGLMAALYRNFLEFTFKSEYAYDYGMPQFLACLDHLFSPLHLDRIFLGRHKFAHFRVWYRDQLRRFVQEILLDPRSLSRPYLNRSTVEAIVKGHLNGSRNYTTAIHQLLSLELLHRLFVENQMTDSAARRGD